MSSLNRRDFLAAGAMVAVSSPVLHAAPKQTENQKPKPKFKLGTVTYNVCKDWDLKTILEICRKTGVAAVECRTTHKHGVEPTLNADDRKRVKGQFADSGVVFWGCGSACEYHSADMAVVKKNIEETKAFIQLTKDLGGRGVKVRPNGVAKGHTVEQACNQIGTALKDVGKAAADAGVEIWVEVHGAVTQLPKNMKMIMDACGHDSVGVTWNSNDIEVVKGSISEGFELLAKHIKSVHINDLEKDAKGVYPYRELFKKLAGIGYDRYTMCEVGKSVEPGKGEEFYSAYHKLWKELAGVA
jgi:sugar phosphate isomerase/epimerase